MTRAFAFILAIGLSMPLAAQRGQGRQGAAPAVSARQAAPVDLTGVWLSIVTEDWPSTGAGRWSKRRAVGRVI